MKNIEDRIAQLVRRRIPAGQVSETDLPTAIELKRVMTLTNQATITMPDMEERLAEGMNLRGHLVVVFNNEINTWDEVVLVLQAATGCTLEEAEIETWEVDNLGKSVVHHSNREECDRIAAIIRTIGIHVEVMED